MRQIVRKFTPIFTIGLNSIWLSFFFIANNINAQSFVCGRAGSYSKDTLSISKLSDIVTLSYVPVCKIIVDSTGFFQFSIKESETQEYYIELNSIKASFIIANGDSIEIRIPKKNTDNHSNSFSQKPIIPAFVITKKNYEVNVVTSLLNRFVKQAQTQILLANEHNKEKISDSLINIADTIFESFDNEYFKIYKKYSIEYLKFLTSQNYKTFSIDSDFAKNEIFYNVPSYVTLFNIVFDNFLSPLNQSINFQNVIKSLQNNNFIELTNYLSTDCKFHFSSKMAQLIAIKGLFDLYYSENNDYLKFLITKTLLNAVSVINDQYLIITLNNVISSLSKFVKGFSVPEFSLSDKSNKNVSLSDFKNVFVYLNFIDINSRAGFQYLELLRRYDDAKIKKLSIVTVLVCDSFDDFKNFLKQNPQYHWTFLFAQKENSVIKNYEVEQFPMFYLINPDKTLSVDNTPSPAENFEDVYNKAFTDWQNSQNNLNQSKIYESNN